MKDCSTSELISAWKQHLAQYQNERTYKYLLLSIAAYWSVNRFLLPVTNETIVEYYKRKAVNLLQYLPIIGDKVKEEIEKTKKDIHHDLMKVFENKKFIVELPQGRTKDEVLELLKEYQSIEHIDWNHGRMSGAVYLDYSNQDQLDLMKDVFSLTAYSNPLHAEVFPEIRKMEAEIGKITLNLFNGSDQSVATISSGGTESIILAVKAYRDYARYERGIRKPIILVPRTVHSAFDKACQLLDFVEIVHIEIDPITMKVDLKKMRKAINSNVCLLVGSAPGYPHGIIDPIREIAELGLKYNIPVHVDSCLGGFLVPFVQEAGFDIPVVDFRLPGVTSISADTHKYAQAPKGTSVLMFKEAKYRHYQYFKVANWPGGIYATHTIAGSRAGSAIATCWASLLHFGRNGYVDATRRILETAAYIRDELKNCEGIFIYGEPLLSVIAIGSKDLNIFQLSNELHKLGWCLNPIQYPSGFHICITNQHTKASVRDKLVEDIKRCTRNILNDKDKQIELGNQAAMYGMSNSVPESLVNVFVDQYLDTYYSTDGY